MNPSEYSITCLPNDIGGAEIGTFERTDEPLEPWEKRCHALADVLEFHKIVNAEEKRHGTEALGTDMVARLSYYQRWIAVFANILFAKGILVPSELAIKMDEVAARFAKERAS